MTPKQYQFAPFRLDPVNQCLWRGTEQISLSPKAFSMLLYLVERPGQLVTKQELLDAIWPDIHVTEGVLKRAVLEIRKVLGDPVEEPRFIQTLHRRGYRFLSAISEPARQAEDMPDRDGIVGRAQEFLQLDAWFEDAVESSRQIVFIAGEAGLGKTTLVDHWMRSLRRRRPAGNRGAAAVARGRCLQQFGSGEPYLPVFEALDGLSQEVGPRLIEVLRSRAPTWLLHMPALISLEDRAKLRDEVFGSTRERMLREITDALEVLSAETPLVVALEDLHWSDPSTIDLLSSVARRTSPARLMILATYRPADAGGRASPLIGAQNELQLHRQCKVLPLAYLSAAATGEYLAERFPGMDSPEALAAALHERTNGNPLYVVCLVDELVRSGGIDADPAKISQMVPDTLQQMFERQAAQLDSTEQEMLDMAAAAGEHFSVAAVAGALGWDGTKVESLCEGLVRRHVILKHWEIVKFPDGTESAGYSFLHALCRDALYRRIPAGRRSRVHGLLGQSRERLFASDPKRMAGQLAGHFELAGELGRAIHYLRMAAEGAAGRYSNQETVRYLERAFGLVERMKAAEQASCRMDLLEQRALMRLTASDMSGATSDFQALADQARMVGAVDRQARALLESVVPLLFVDHLQALAAIDEAKAALAGSTDPILGGVADVYRAFFRIYLFGWNQEFADLLSATLPKLKASADLRLQSRLAWMEAATHGYVADYAAACERAEEARRYSRKAGVFFDYFIGTMFLNWAHLHRGDLGQAIRVARDGAELAARNASQVALLWFTVREAWVQMEAFDFETALATYERSAADPATIANRPVSYPLFLWLGLARLGCKDYEGAWDAFEQVRLAFEAGGTAYQVMYPLTHGQAECEIGRDNLVQGRTFAQRLIQVAGEHREPGYAARGHLLLAEIASIEGDPMSAADQISLALAALDKREAWTVEWRIHAAAARVFAKLGRHRESDESRERGLRVAERVAATLAGEPALQESFLSRVQQDLANARSSCA